jgi:hypothetical protein
MNWIELNGIELLFLYPDAVFIISVPSCFNCCPSPLDITGIPVLPHNFRTPLPVYCY